VLTIDLLTREYQGKKKKEKEKFECSMTKLKEVYSENIGWVDIS